MTSRIDRAILDANCAGDRRMMRELIGMGIETLGRSIAEIEAGLPGADWQAIGRTVHRLRPVLSYCGVTGLGEELLGVETSAREGTGLDELPLKLQSTLEGLRGVLEELRLISESLR